MLNIAREIGIEKVDIHNVIRFGQISGSRERLLKVEVTNINSKRLLLFNAKKLYLASSELIRKIYISPVPQETTSKESMFQIKTTQRSR